MDFIKIEESKPTHLQNIIGITNVGTKEGIYLKSDIFQTKDGLYNFTKWKPIE